MRQTLIREIPCELQTRRMRQAVQMVLVAIAERFPNDLARLREAVRQIVPLPEEESQLGTMGRWCPDDPDAYWYAVCGETYARQAALSEMITDEWSSHPPVICRGMVKLLDQDDESEPVPALNPLALVAHEFGHACTRREDVFRRGEFFLEESLEWATEYAAAWYAYRWGFGRMVKPDWSLLVPQHSFFPPGTTFT